MGIVSWIKDKYYNSRFNKANTLISEGAVEDAVEILEGILDKHPGAPSALLSIIHHQIEDGDRSKINDATRLYCSYPNLKDDCILFANTISSRQTIIVVVIDYVQSIYCAGLREVKTLFVDIAQYHVLGESSVTDLASLTNEPTLLSALSERLFSSAKQLYSDYNLRNCNRVCELILPILSNG